MEQIVQQIESYKKEVESFSATDAKAVEEFRIKWLGTKGLVKILLAEMKNVPNERKKEFGQAMNEFKSLVEEKYESLKNSTSNQPPATSNQQPATSNQPDLSLPGDPIPLGSRHPISLMTNRIINIFQRLGFAVAEGPEIEDDWHNFTALNL